MSLVPLVTGDGSQSVGPIRHPPFAYKMAQPRCRSAAPLSRLPVTSLIDPRKSVWCSPTIRFVAGEAGSPLCLWKTEVTTQRQGRRRAAQRSVAPEVWRFCVPVVGQDWAPIDIVDER